ncbi:GH25 family lysozyme [Bacillus marasmi]|uniref:GH25 family lysozyme n=1 Tax=Bacillus marasmi TaxID=1926279 RepID=UPI0011C82134|nr:GH25 family lysozyme [Bacillus marasmi]
MGKIIDISHHQVPSNINYDELAKHVDLAIIRTQYGSKTIDKHYKTHHAEFRKRGVPTQAYAWVRGVSIADMEVEATDFYNRTKEFSPEVYWLDVEEKSMSDMRAGVSAYIKKLRELGAKKVGVYIAHHLFTSFHLDLSEADAVWIPHYGKNNGDLNSKPAYPCDLHQYTSVGRIPGYDGNLDINILTGSKPLDWFTGEQVAAAPQPTTAHPNNDAYMHIVVKGDTLSAIATKYGLTVGYIANLNGIENPNKIYPGQRLMLKGNIPVQTQPAAKRTIHLPATASTWTVYKLNRPAVKANPSNIAGTLKPSKFGGLSYEILKDLGGWVFEIQTANFGRVKIYGHPSTGAIVK